MAAQPDDELPKISFSEDEADDDRTVLSRPSEVLGVTHDRRESACFIVIAGTAVGEVFRLHDGEAIIGRAAGVHIHLEDEGISRRHARVRQVGGDVILEDLGSANGTFVNGEAIREHVLCDGDKVQVGSTTIIKFTFQDHIEESFQRNMLEAARRDGLTKAFSKAYFLDQLTKEVAFANRHGANVSLIMFDLDHFKQINDELGHLAGDAVLVALAAACRATLRTEDVFARYGGEEFAVICRATSLADASHVAERLRATVEHGSFPHTRVTISAGVAEHVIGEGATALIARADANLYAAKRAGRNRVVAAQ
jgi:two-component system, cell cycle response regulator